MYTMLHYFFQWAKTTISWGFFGTVRNIALYINITHSSIEWMNQSWQTSDTESLWLSKPRRAKSTSSSILPRDISFANTTVESPTPPARRLWCLCPTNQTRFDSLNRYVRTYVRLLNHPSAGMYVPCMECCCDSWLLPQNSQPAIAQMSKLTK